MGVTRRLPYSPPSLNLTKNSKLASSTVTVFALGRMITSLCWSQLQQPQGHTPPLLELESANPCPLPASYIRNADTFNDNELFYCITLVHNKSEKNW